MEGLVALSLACNIFQVIQFGFESVSVIHQTYEKGRLDENVQLQYATTQLEQATQSTILQQLIRDHITPARGGQTITRFGVKSCRRSNKFAQRTQCTGKQR
jgi:hypothetical protein